MLGETYPFVPIENEPGYIFRSVGKQGEIFKIVLFQKLENGNYNLAFGDIEENGDFNDKIVSNNEDFVMVLSTVAKCAYHFVENNPGISIEIVPVDKTGQTH